MDSPTLQAPISQPGMKRNPAPPPVEELPISKALKNADTFQLLTIEAVMVLAIVMCCLPLLGSLRKRTSNALFQMCMWVTVVSTPLLMSYCIGKMTSDTCGSLVLKNELFIIWGLLLLVGLGSYGTISAFELQDNETALAAYVEGSVKSGFVFGLLLVYVGAQTPSYVKWILHLLVPMMLLRLSDRASSLAYASKTNISNGVASIVEIVAEFMEWDVRKTVQAEEEDTADPKSMDGYRYLVGLKQLQEKRHYHPPPYYHRDIEKETEIIVTTQEIWQCEGELLSSRGGDPEGRLKDTCLSFALFWMLLRKYTGYSFPEVTSLGEKTWNFVRYGLIPDITPPNTERAFRVIEQELSFVYDYFYTKIFAIYLNGTGFMFFRFIIVVLYSVIAQIILKNHNNTVLVKFLNDLPSVDLQVIITKVVIYTMLLSEIILMLHYLVITQWSRVKWICTYVEKQLWKSETWYDTCLRLAIECVCRHSLQTNFKHWRREIDQYSLLHSHDYVNPMYYLLGWILPPHILDRPKRGRIASNSIPFSTNLKIAILSSLQTNGRKLNNGKTSLQKYGVETDFSWACNLESHTQSILVWHIATSFCEVGHHNRYHGNSTPDYLLVPTSLSKYCAYLVVFMPELLPDHPNTTLNLINNVIDEANQMFNGCSNMEFKYAVMRLVTDQQQDSKDPILNKGIWLGKSLMDKMCNESLWEMLGDFWTELLLYLAPSENAEAHITHLANGGHLITHLWALLTHAGILTRD